MGTVNTNKDNTTIPTYEYVTEQQEEKTEKLIGEEENSNNVTVEIPISLLDDFPHHPFKVRNDEEMQSLVESIKGLGQLTPAIVRKTEDGRYQIISGHRRKAANIELGNKTMPCQIRDISEDEATVLMVESNIYRTNITTSERAFAYKMRFDAIKRMKKAYFSESGAQIKEIPEYIKGKSRDITASEIGVSQTTGTRYIRFTKLTPPLLEELDKGKLTQESAFNLSYIGEENMNAVVSEIRQGAKIPDKVLALQMKAMAEDDNLTPDVIHKIMNPQAETHETKPEKFSLKGTEIKEHIPEWVFITSDLEEFLTNAIDLYVDLVEAENFEEYIKNAKALWDKYTSSENNNEDDVNE